MQGVLKIHGITSGMSSSYVDNKNSLCQHRSGNAVSEFLRSVYDTQLFTLPCTTCSIYAPPAWKQGSTRRLIATRRRSQIPGMLLIVLKHATVRFRRVSTSSTGDNYTKDFKWPHKEKSREFKSDERGGQAVVPRLPIQWPGNFRFRYLRATRLKCAGAPSCMKCSSRRMIQWHVSQEIRHVVF
jgi:hypothetical protein